MEATEIVEVDSLESEDPDWEMDEVWQMRFEGREDGDGAKERVQLTSA